MRPEAAACLTQSREDLITAQVNLDGERFYACVFFAHQAAEKALKALHVVNERSLAPRGHNLVDMARRLQAPESIMEDARELNPEYFTTRYPDAAVGVPAEMYSRASAVVHLDAARRILRWVESRLPSEPS